MIAPSPPRRFCRSANAAKSWAARKASETLLSQYPDQREIATEARTPLASLTKLSKDSGIAMRQVWAGPAASYYPAPDGRLLAYVDWDSGGNVAVRDLPTGKTRLITTSANGPDHFALNPIVSPDGKSIAYQWQNEEFTYDLRAVGIDGSDPRVVYADSNYEVYPAAQSSDSRQIAVRRYILKKAAKGGPTKTEIALIDVSDGSIHVLKSYKEYLLQKFPIPMTADTCSMIFPRTRIPGGMTYLCLPLRGAAKSRWFSIQPTTGCR